MVDRSLTSDLRVGLERDGFRFVYQDGVFSWTHPASITAEAIDCTDMDDATFERFVEKRACVTTSS